MKYMLAFILNIMTLGSCISQQNLIFNGDFEMYDTCPLNSSTVFDMQIEYALGWYSPSEGTSDYFNTCSIGNLNPYTDVGVPHNFIGYQPSYSGEGYAGFYGYVEWVNGKEYIQSKLTTPLSAGKVYHIGFFTSLADSSQFALNQIGAYLSQTSISRPDYYPFNVLPQITSSPNSYITESNEWVSVDGYFLAAGGEEYITIGNFQDSVMINVLEVNNSTNTTGQGASYYYIDSVYVTETEYEISFNNIFTPNGDNINDDYILTIIGIAEWKCTIYNRWGSEIIILNNAVPFWDGTLHGTPCSQGVYYYVFESKSPNIRSSGNLYLLR